MAGRNRRGIAMVKADVMRELAEKSYRDLKPHQKKKLKNNSGGNEMFRDPQEMRRRLQEIVEKFRQKGATSPEKALTLEELGLPPRFEQAMHRRLGQTGIFVEVNGKYYLNEERLRQIQQERAQAGL